MTVQRVLTVDGQVIRARTSLFDTDTGEVFWYRGVEDETVQLAGVNRSAAIGFGQLYARIESGRLVVESQPVGFPE